MTTRMMLSIAAAALLAPVVASAEVQRGEGAPMKFDIGSGIMINGDSTLNREWSIVTDEALPVKLTSLRLKTRRSTHNMVFDILYKLELTEDVVAIETRFIPFNIWGEQTRPLSATTIEDVSAGERTLTGNWRILSENDAFEHYAVLGYVARVKLANGTILEANSEEVIEEARRFSDDFSSGDLDPDEAE